MCKIQTKERAHKKFSPVFSRIAKRFRLLLDGDRFVVPEEVRRQVVDALQFGHQGPAKMLAESNIIWWYGMKKDIENEYSTGTACLSFGKN